LGSYIETMRGSGCYHYIGVSMLYTYVPQPKISSQFKNVANRYIQM